MDICIVCGSNKVHFAADLNLAQCKKCGFIWQMVQDGTVLYDEQYFRKYLNYPVTEIAKLRVNEIKKFIAPHTGAVIEIGYGTGNFLMEMKRYGYKPYGVEINRYAWLHTREIQEIPRLGPWPESDCVAFFDSLEHSQEILTYLHLAFKSSPLVCISVPDTGNRNLVDFHKWRHYRPDEHFWYFNEKTLTKLLSSFNFILLNSSHVEDQMRQAPWPNNILTCVFGSRESRVLAELSNPIHTMVAERSKLVECGVS